MSNYVPLIITYSETTKTAKGLHELICEFGRYRLRRKYFDSKKEGKETITFPTYCFERKKIYLDQENIEDVLKNFTDDEYFKEGKKLLNKMSGMGGKNGTTINRMVNPVHKSYFEREDVYHDYNVYYINRKKAQAVYNGIYRVIVDICQYTNKDTKKYYDNLRKCFPDEDFLCNDYSVSNYIARPYKIELFLEDELRDASTSLINLERSIMKR